MIATAALQRRDTPAQTCNSIRNGMHRLGDYTHQLSWLMKQRVNLYCERSAVESSLKVLSFCPHNHGSFCTRNIASIRLVTLSLLRIEDT